MEHIVMMLLRNYVCIYVRAFIVDIHLSLSWCVYMHNLGLSNFEWGAFWIFFFFTAWVNILKPSASSLLIPFISFQSSLQTYLAYSDVWKWLDFSLKFPTKQVWLQNHSNKCSHNNTKTDSANGSPLNFWGLMITYLRGTHVYTFISWSFGWIRRWSIWVSGFSDNTP